MMSDHSHVPKRAVGHSLFLPESERQVIELSDHKRQAYAESSRPSLLTNLQENYNITDYRANYAQTVSADYHPAPSFKPKNGLTSGSPEFPNFRPARLWRSEYQASRISGVGSPSAHPPVVGRHTQRHAPVVSVDLGLSTAAEAFTAPTAKLAVSGSQAKPFFIPGYQGFVPSNTHNPYVERYASGTLRGEEARERSNITENFQRVLPGYTGYLPVNGTNDRNPRQASSMTETGSAYAVQRTWTLI